MTQTKISSRDFNQDVSRAKRAAENGPVIISDRGEPAFVLMRYTMYRNLTAGEPGIRELLALPGVEDIEFEAPPLADGLFRVAEFS